MSVNSPRSRLPPAIFPKSPPRPTVGSRTVRPESRSRRTEEDGDRRQPEETIPSREERPPSRAPSKLTWSPPETESIVAKRRVSWDPSLEKPIEGQKWVITTDAPARITVRSLDPQTVEVHVRLS